MTGWSRGREEILRMIERRKFVCGDVPGDTEPGIGPLDGRVYRASIRTRAERAGMVAMSITIPAAREQSYQHSAYLCRIVPATAPTWFVGNRANEGLRTRPHDQAKCPRPAASDGTRSRGRGSLRRLPRLFPITFKLAGISASLAAKLAKAGGVRVTLSGPGISPVTVTAAWQAKTGTFGAKIAIPAKFRTGVNYAITVRENVGTGLVVAPQVGTAVSPEIIRFS